MRQLQWWWMDINWILQHWTTSIGDIVCIWLRNSQTDGTVPPWLEISVFFLWSKLPIPFLGTLSKHLNLDSTFSELSWFGHLSWHLLMHLSSSSFFFFYVLLFPWLFVYFSLFSGFQKPPHVLQLMHPSLWRHFSKFLSVPLLYKRMIVYGTVPSLYWVWKPSKVNTVLFWQNTCYFLPSKANLHKLLNP